MRKYIPLFKITESDRLSAVAEPNLPDYERKKYPGYKRKQPDFSEATIYNYFF